VEIGGAVKNVLAIATGICDALALGQNARAALITRGLAEVTRFGVALGASRSDLHGTDRRRRPDPDLHRRAFAQPAGRLDAWPRAAAVGGARPRRPRRRGRMVGGGGAPARLCSACRMPITEAVCAVLEDQASPQQALDRLLARDPKREAPE
jgi:glycerol-3-phosphate dehydrogenase (NAD(P)+)